MQLLRIAFYFAMISSIGCSTSKIVSPATSTSPATPTLKPPAPAPTPYIPPGSYTSVSPNWCGYSVPAYGITGVRATWRQPVISGNPDSDIYVWIGVGGWGTTYNQLIQIGTLAYMYPDGHSENNAVWYEMVPQNNILTKLLVSPGDQMSAIMQLTPGSTSNWSLNITDITANRTFNIELTYPSNQEYADFIVEDPYRYIGSDAPQYPFPTFSPVTFTGADVRYNDQWIPLAALRSMRVTLQGGGLTMATAGQIMGDDTFTVTDNRSIKSK